MTDEPLFPQSSAPKARAKPENKTLSRIGLALASVGVAVVSFFHIAKELPGIPRDTSSEEALANASYAYGHIVGGLFFDVLVAWAILYFVFVRPSKRKVGGKYFAILAGSPC